jgi:hypothetical protein
MAALEPELQRRAQVRRSAWLLLAVAFAVYAGCMYLQYRRNRG